MSLKEVKVILIKISGEDWKRLKSTNMETRLNAFYGDQYKKKIAEK